MFKALKPGDRLPILILDTIGRCNLKCVMCPQSSENAGHPRGKMDFSLYRKIFDELASDDGIKADAILPFWNGEALLHPEFPEMIRYAAMSRKKNHGFNVFSLHTNFLLAGRETAKLMVDSGIFGPITVSIDAVSQETYSKIRQGGDYEKLIENLDYFLYYRNSKNVTQPSLSVQFIVMDQNKEQAEEFFRLWESRFSRYSIRPALAFDDTACFAGDTIYFRLLQTGNASEQAHARNMHQQVRQHFNPVEIQSVYTSDDTYQESVSPARPPCVVLWQQLAVRSDGEVSPCCRDVSVRMNLGRAHEKSLLELFFGQKANNLRNMHIRGEFEKLPLCSGCLDQTAHHISGEEIKIYQSWVNHCFDETDLLISMGKFGKALHQILDKLYLNCADKEIWKQAGDCYLGLSELNPAEYSALLKKASESFLKALSYGHDSELLIRIARIHRQLADYQTALQFLDKADNLPATDSERAMICFLNGEIRKAMAYCPENDELVSGLKVIMGSEANRKSEKKVFICGLNGYEMAFRLKSAENRMKFQNSRLRFIFCSIRNETPSEMYQRFTVDSVFCDSRPGDILLITGKEFFPKEEFRSKFCSEGLSVICIDNGGNDSLHLSVEQLQFIAEQFNLACSEIMKKEWSDMNPVYHAYRQFKESQQMNDFLLVASFLTEKRKFQSFIILHKHYRIRHYKVFAYLANSYQETGDYARARHIYYKLARRFEPKFWESTAYCLRMEKRFILSALAYMIAAIKNGDVSLFRKAWYSLSRIFLS